VLRLVDHPLVHECLAELRDSRTSPERFRSLANRISVLLGAEALRDVPTIETTVDTPLGPSPARRLAADVVMAPVLRAGLGMLPGMLELVPNARVGHLGLQRDERTAVASQYYAKLPKAIQDSYVVLIDPMLATGGSAVAALDMLTKSGARHLRLVCIVAAPEGVAAVESAYPHVPIFTPVVDRELNAHKFIVPGLGDFGDRLFGTV
jgi:uracil phosphoribosyltransferase